MNLADSRKELLIWYEQNKSEMPWRAESPAPYHVLLSEFMLQQTTVAAVKPYFENFIKNWPDIQSLARADDDDVMMEWAGLGYYSRARNLLKTARAISLLPAFPQEYDQLIKLPGIGDYTAKAIGAIAFNQPYVPIDGNVKRILARFHQIDDPIDKSSLELTKAAQKWESTNFPGALAQAFMDLGRNICKPKNPQCAECPLAANCQAFQNCQTENYPKRSPKPEKKQWQGYAYIIETPKGIAFEFRPKGLLGEMWGLPSIMGKNIANTPPMPGNWQDAGAINHVFTHIQLNLNICYICLESAPMSNQWKYLTAPEAAKTATLWKKALAQYEKSKAYQKVDPEDEREYDNAKTY